MKNGKYIDGNGAVRYYKDNEYHREDGPAYEDLHNYGYKSWWINGIYHREDGSTIVCEGGFNNKEWWYYGVQADNEKQFYDKKWRKEVLLDLV